MPLLKKQYSGSSGIMGVWEISESEGELESLIFPEDLKQISPVILPRKRKEKAAARILLRELLTEAGIVHREILYDDFGKPHLDIPGIYISISHSQGYAAAVINQGKPVGIDIEVPQNKIISVAGRVLSENEVRDVQEDPVKATFYWSCKEALYKLHGIRNLDFKKDLFVHPFDPSDDFTCIGEIRSKNTISTHALRCMWIKNAVLAYNT